MTPSERGRIIWRIGDLILEHNDELAQLESLDNGKPFPVAQGADVPLAADLFHYMAGWATKIEGQTINISCPTCRALTSTPTRCASPSGSPGRSSRGTSRC
jgi:phenylacetaldehyde dehydrogenase